MNQEEEQQQPKPMKIVGVNLAIMVGYSVLVRMTGTGGGENLIGNAFLLAILIGIHVIVCLIVAISGRPKGWLLSALLVLLIGFSTCVGVFSI